MYNKTVKKTVAAACLCAAVIISCAPRQVTTADVQPVTAVQAPYVLGQRDVVDITVSGHPELSGTGAVDKNGAVELPLTDDLVQAAGLTIDELEERVTETLTRYVQKPPRVKIKIAEYESKMVYVVGEVGAPGKYPLEDYTVRVRDIIFAAGLTFEGADEADVYIIKPDLTDPTYRTVNLHDILYKGILRDNIILQPGDIVYVRPTVMSKINKAIDQILTPASKAAALFYMYTTWSNITSGRN